MYVRRLAHPTARQAYTCSGSGLHRMCGERRIRTSPRPRAHSKRSSRPPIVNRQHSRNFAWRFSALRERASGMGCCVQLYTSQYRLIPTRWSLFVLSSARMAALFLRRCYVYLARDWISQTIQLLRHHSNRRICFVLLCALRAVPNVSDVGFGANAWPINSVHAVLRA